MHLAGRKVERRNRGREEYERDRKERGSEGGREKEGGRKREVRRKKVY